MFFLTNIAAFARRGPTTFQVYAADPNSYGFWPIMLSL